MSEPSETAFEYLGLGTFRNALGSLTIAEASLLRPTWSAHAVRPCSMRSRVSIPRLKSGAAAGHMLAVSLSSVHVGVDVVFWNHMKLKRPEALEGQAEIADI